MLVFLTVCSFVCLHILVCTLFIGFIAAKMKCFVCDVKTESTTNIENVVLPNSKVSAIKKLGQLFPKRFYVVCEGDVICQSCVRLIEKLDVLDEERANVKRNVLNLIERKYLLKDGDLNYPTEEPYEPPLTFAARRKLAEEELEKVTNMTTKDPRSRIWMQCTSCKYTTNYTQFVKRHVKKQTCGACGGPMKDKVCIRNCSVNQMQTNDSPVLSSLSTATILQASMSVEEDEEQGNILIAEAAELEGQISIPEPTEGDSNDDKELYYNVLDSNGESGSIREVLVANEEGESVQIMSWNEETNSLVPFVLK